MKRKSIEKSSRDVFDRLNKLLDELAVSIPAMAMGIVKDGKTIYLAYRGEITESSKTIDSFCRFDIASMTKIFSGLAFMRMVEDGDFSLDEPLYRCFPEFDRMYPIEKNGEIIGKADARGITWQHVLTHTTGMGWTRAKTRPSLPGIGESLNDIFALPFADKPNTRIIYTDLPMILMGRAMEKKAQMPLDKIVDEFVITPLGLKSTGYNRGNGICSRECVVPTELDDVFRNERCWGYVHDENAFLMDGVAAHAGIFSNVDDLSELGIALLEMHNKGGLLKKSTMELMAAQHVVDGEDRRGLIWQLSNCGGNQNAYTGVLSPMAFGHAGYTGCFMWMDPMTQAAVVFLSNDVYRGRDDRILFDYRRRIMELAKEIIIS